MTNSCAAEGSLGFGFCEDGDLGFNTYRNRFATTLGKCGSTIVHSVYYWTDVCGDIVNDEEHKILCEMFGSVMGSGMSPSPALLWTRQLLTILPGVYSIRWMWSHELHEFGAALSLDVGAHVSKMLSWRWPKILMDNSSQRI